MCGLFTLVITRLDWELHAALPRGLYHTLLGWEKDQIKCKVQFLLNAHHFHTIVINILYIEPSLSQGPSVPIYGLKILFAIYSKAKEILKSEK